MEDVLYDLLEHCKKDLGAQTASVLFGKNGLRMRPVLCVFMAQYNLCITFKLDEILDMIDENDYEYATEIFDNEIERIILLQRRKGAGDE